MTDEAIISMRFAEPLRVVHQISRHLRLDKRAEASEIVGDIMLRIERVVSNVLDRAPCRFELF